MDEKGKAAKALLEELQRAREEQLNILSSGSDSMRKNLILTDVIIVCDGQEMPAHRLLLAASSPYFHAMLTNGMKETLAEKVDLPIIDANTMETLLDFIYTGNIKVSMDNIEEIKTLLAAADQLQISIVFQYCCSLLLKTLSDNHFLELWEIANRYHNNDMKNQTMAYIAEHFQETSGEPEFLQLPLDVIVSVITRDEMKKQDMDSVLKAVFKWVKFNKGEREAELKSLLTYINFQDLSNDYLLHIVDEESLMNESMELMRFVMKTITCRYLKNLMSSSSEVQNVPVISQTSLASWNIRKPSAAIEVQQLVIFRNADSQDEGAIQWFYPDTGKLSASTPFTFRFLLDSAVCYHDGQIYFIGGRTKSLQVCESIFGYDIVTYKWSTVTPLLEARYASSAIQLDDFIYVVGGAGKNNIALETVERFDVYRNRWQKMASMTVRRKYPALLSGGDKIFAMSCIQGNMVSVLEYYNPASNQWTGVNHNDIHANSFRQHIFFENNCKQRIGIPASNFKQGMCFLSWQDDTIHILTQSALGDIRLHSKKIQQTKYQCRQVNSKLPPILNFASVQINGSYYLVVVDAEGSISRYNPETYGWVKIASSLERPSYAIFLEPTKIQKPLDISQITPLQYLQ